MKKSILELTEWDDEALEVTNMCKQFENFIEDLSIQQSNPLNAFYKPTLQWVLESLRDYYEDEIFHGENLINHLSIDLGDWVQLKVEE